MVELSYLDKLRKATDETGNILSFRFDLVHHLMPEQFSSEDVYVGLTAYAERLLSFLKDKGHAPASFKPNLGFYPRYNVGADGMFAGSEALADILQNMRKMFPKSNVTLDSKNGDIATSSLNYAETGFNGWRADAITVSPYMGDDSVEPLAKFCQNGHGVYVLCRTSNKGAKNLQSQILEDGRFELTAQVA